MSKAFTCEIKGMDIVKQMVKNIGEELRPSQTRQIMDEGGRVVASEAKRSTKFPGQIGDAFRKDIAVSRDRSKSGKNAEYVIVGPRFKPYAINGRDEKVAVIGQHLSEGFNQSDRVTKKGQRRGKVKARTNNPVLDGFRQSLPKMNAAINKGIVKHLNKVKRKYNAVVK